MPVTRTKCRGSTVSRSELATTRPAVKNWLTVTTMRRSRPIAPSVNRTLGGRVARMKVVARPTQHGTHVAKAVVDEVPDELVDDPIERQPSLVATGDELHAAEQGQLMTRHGE